MSSGQSRWSKPLVKAAGQRRWSKPLVKAAGQSRWSKPLVKVAAQFAGQRRWSKSLVKVAGQSRWSKSLVKVAVSIERCGRRPDYGGGGSEGLVRGPVEAPLWSAPVPSHKSRSSESQKSPFRVTGQSRYPNRRAEPLAEQGFRVANSRASIADYHVDNLARFLPHTQVAEQVFPSHKMILPRHGR